MNYYIQGCAAKADQIKAAFEKLGYDTTGHLFTAKSVLYFTLDGGIRATTCNCTPAIIKTHPDYQELGLPKPHYDIANFKPFGKVLVRFCDGANWCCALFSHYCTRGNCHFVCSGGSVTQCIPFNDDTKHLLGNTDMCDECYINW